MIKNSYNIERSFTETIEVVIMKAYSCMEPLVLPCSNENNVIFDCHSRNAEDVLKLKVR